jgi:hypothetical protein
MKRSTCIAFLLLAFAGCNFEEAVPIEMVSVNQTQPLGDEKALDSTIHFDVGSLEISGETDSDLLYSLDLEYDKSSYTPDIDFDPAGAGEEGRLFFSLASTHRVGIRRERHNNRLRLALSESIPMNLNVTTGVGDARLALSGLKIASLKIDSGVGAAKISAYEPNSILCEHIDVNSGVGRLDAVGLGNLNFREFQFEGGVGGANLDFTGEWQHDADIRIQVGVGGVHMQMPRGIGVRIEAEKHFLSGMRLDGFIERDSSYYSENYNDATIRVSVRVVTGVGGFRISWI